MSTSKWKVQKEKTLLLLEPNGHLREYFGVHREAETMVTTKNQDNQQNNHEENSSAILVEVKRELKMMRKLT